MGKDSGGSDRVVCSFTGDAARFWRSLREQYVDKEKGPCRSDSDLLRHLRRSVTDPWDIFLDQLDEVDRAAQTAMDTQQYALWSFMQAIVRQAHSGLIDAERAHKTMRDALTDLGDPDEEDEP